MPSTNYDWVNLSPREDAMSYVDEPSEESFKAWMPSPDDPPSPLPPRRSFSVKEHDRLLDRAEKDNFDLKLKIVFLQKIVDKCRGEGLTDVIVQNETMKDQLVRAAKRITDGDDEIAKLNSKIHKLKCKNQNFAEQVDQLTTELEEADRDKAAHQKLREDYEEQSKTIDQNTSALHAAVDKVEAELQVRISDHETQAKDFLARLEDERQHRKDDRAQHDSIQAEVEGLRQKHQAFVVKIRQLEDYIPTLQTDIATDKARVKERLGDLQKKVHDRDLVLETQAKETTRLSELLERERQGRQADRAQQDQWQLSHVHVTRTVTQKEARITELEAELKTERKRLTTLEESSRAQLYRRNELLLDVWKRLSTLCGPDFIQRNALVANRLLTVDVVHYMLPEFGTHLLDAIRTIRASMGLSRDRLGNLERDLWATYQGFEVRLEAESKKIQELDAMLQAEQLSATFKSVPEVAKLRGENRLLKSELSRYPRVANTDAPEASEQRWSHRLREMERRVKVEREARLLDRAGARRRLQESELELAKLREELEREKSRQRR